MDFRSEIQRAIELHRTGSLAEAEAIYRQILSLEPANPDALHLLGMVAHQTGNSAAAAELIRRAISVSSAQPAYWSNYGQVLLALGQVADAIDACRRGVTLRDDYPEAHCNLAAALQAAGNLEEAEAECRRAIALAADFGTAYGNLAAVLIELGRNQEAAAAAMQAASLMPDSSMAQRNLGWALFQMGRFAQAEACLRKAVSLEPLAAVLRNMLGMTLHRQGRFEEAAEQFTQAAQLDPNFNEARTNLGAALWGRGNFAEAEAACREAVRLAPKNAPAYANLGLTIQSQGRLAEAAEHFDKAMHLDPNDDESAMNLLIGLNADEQADNETIFREHARVGQRMVQRRTPRMIFANTPDPHRRLRVGYVSGDFRRHAVSFFIEPLLEGHNREQFEVFGYSNLGGVDDVTRRMEGHCDHWRSIVGASDAEVVGLIERDGIDILVDLAGHTGGNRIRVFARRAAPVQVTYLGYANTTGLATIDYRITDAVADPPGISEKWNVEELVRLKCAWCYRPFEYSPTVQPLPARHNRNVTFGSFNHVMKLQPGVMHLWAQVLAKAPGSRLIVKGRGLGDVQTQLRIRQALGDMGVRDDRLELVGAVAEHSRHLEAYGHVDIALDSFPYNGTTTTCEAMWMGVPVVTLAGDRHASRVGASLLTTVGLEELVASNPEQYVRIAAELAGDLKRLEALRWGLREQMRASRLMDQAAFVAEIESAYRTMWKRWCEHGVRA